MDHKRHGETIHIGYDEMRCKACGWILVGGSWGVASRRWFSTLDDAKFFKAHGRRVNDVSDESAALCGKKDQEAAWQR